MLRLLDFLFSTDKPVISRRLFNIFLPCHAIHMLNEEAVVRISTTVGFFHVLNHRFLDGECNELYSLDRRRTMDFDFNTNSRKGRYYYSASTL